MDLDIQSLRRIGVAIVILHALIVTVHSIAHTYLFISMNLWQNFYIMLVILAAPIVSAVFLWKRRRLGFVLLALSMAGSLLFGFYYHFVAIGSDNVFALPAGIWSQTFQITAVLLALTEFAGAAIGFLGLKS